MSTTNLFVTLLALAVGLASGILATMRLAGNRGPIGWMWLHIVLLPVFPLLALGFVVFLREPPCTGTPRVARMVAWICAAVYAAA